jgi:hypothetical protein
MIAEYQRNWEEQYKIKTSEQLQSVIDKRNTRNEKNTQTQRERDTAADMEETRVDGDDDDEGGNSEDEDGEYDWFGPANPRNLNEERKSFFLIASLLDPRTKSLSFCDDKHFPTSWQREGHGFLSMEFKSFYSEIHDTEVDLPHRDTSVG